MMKFCIHIDIDMMCTASNHVIRNINRPILCGNVVEFDGKKCLYSRSFRFYKHFDITEKNMGCLAQKNKKKKKKKQKNKQIFCHISIISQCRQDL